MEALAVSGAGKVAMGFCADRRGPWFDDEPWKAGGLTLAAALLFEIKHKGIKRTLKWVAEHDVLYLDMLLNIAKPTAPVFAALVLVCEEYEWKIAHATQHRDAYGPRKKRKRA